MYYRLKLTPDDNGTFLVASPDLPEVTTFAISEADAVSIGNSAIVEALAALLARREATPLPDAPADTGRRSVVRIPTLLAAKIALMNESISQGVTRAELAQVLEAHGLDRALLKEGDERLDVASDGHGLQRDLEIDGLDRDVVLLGERMCEVLPLELAHHPLGDLEARN